MVVERDVQRMRKQIMMGLSRLESLFDLRQTTRGQNTGRLGGPKSLGKKKMTSKLDNLKNGNGIKPSFNPLMRKEVTWNLEFDEKES